MKLVIEIEKMLPREDPRFENELCKWIGVLVEAVMHNSVQPRKCVEYLERMSDAHPMSVQNHVKQEVNY